MFHELIRKVIILENPAFYARTLLEIDGTFKCFTNTIQSFFIKFQEKKNRLP